MPTPPPKPPPGNAPTHRPGQPAKPAAQAGTATPIRSLRQRHDETYRKIFGDRHMMAEFARDFLPSALLAGWDLETLEIKNTQWVNQRLERRAGDLVWRLRRRAAGEEDPTHRPVRRRQADWLYLYLLLEQQGRPDHRMPLRELEYVTLFLNALLDAGEIPSTGPYPLVLPIVLYNGRRPWRAGTSLQHYQPAMPQALRPYNPAFEFLLVDLNTLDPLHVQSVVSACAVFFQMELEDDLQGLVDLIPKLDDLLPDDEHAALRQTLATWIHEVAILARGGRIDDALLQAQSLSEVHTMLAERVKDWFADARQEGKTEGKLEGAAFVLQAQLQQKFGALPTWAQARVAEGDAESLQRWALNLLQADNLEAVFDEPA